MTDINSVRLSSSKGQAHGRGYSQLCPLMLNVPSLGLCFPICEMGQGGGAQIFPGPNGATSSFCFLMSRRKPRCAETCR